MLNSILLFLQIIPLDENNQGIAMSSLMELGEKFILRDNFVLDIATFLKERNCHVLIVMGIEICSNDEKQEEQIERHKHTKCSSNQQQHKAKIFSRSGVNRP